MILLAIVMVLSLCACAPSTEDPETTGNAQLSGNPSTAPTTQPPEAPTTQPSEPVPTDPPVVLNPIDPKEHIENENYIFTNTVCNKDADGKDVLIAHNPTGMAMAVNQTKVSGSWTFKARVQIGTMDVDLGEARFPLCKDEKGTFVALISFKYDPNQKMVRFDQAQQYVADMDAWSKTLDKSAWLSLSQEAAFDISISYEEGDYTLTICIFDVNGKMLFIRETEAYSPGMLESITHVGVMSEKTQVQFSNIEIISE